MTGIGHAQGLGAVRWPRSGDTAISGTIGSRVPSPNEGGQDGGDRHRLVAGKDDGEGHGGERGHVRDDDQRTVSRLWRHST